MGLQDNTNDGAKQYEWASKIVKVGTQDSQSGPEDAFFALTKVNFSHFRLCKKVSADISDDTFHTSRQRRRRGMTDGQRGEAGYTP